VKVVVGASLVVLETGGGRTQFIFGHGERIEERFSVDVGAVEVTERFEVSYPDRVAQLVERLLAEGDDRVGEVVGRLDHGDVTRAG
jgi:exopolyphosphatase/pppGpp-phosphohydrolase